MSGRDRPKRKSNHGNQAAKSFFKEGSIFKEGFSFRGVLVTSQNSKEKFAVRDSYRILNDYFDKIYGEVHTNKQMEELDDQVLKIMSGEADQIIDNKVLPPKSRVFNQIKVSARGMIFIRFDDRVFPKSDSAENFISQIFDDIISKHSLFSRSVCRMIPVECACLASFTNFKLFAPEIIAQYFKPVEHRVTWTLVYKCRNNSKFNKEEFLGFITPLIPENYVFLSYNADLTILLDITQHLMCLSVLKNFEKYRKFSFFSFIDHKKDEEGSLDNKDNGSKDEKQSEMSIEQEGNEAIGEEQHAPVDQNNNEDNDISLF
jgi:hypothetical protein